MALAWLVSPQKQFMSRSGTINAAGYLRVFDAATDDPVVTYSNFSGGENPELVQFDSDGRANVIADDSRAYRIEVYDRYGSLLWTASPVWCMTTGGGVTATQVISSDRSVAITRTAVGGTVQYDLSTRVGDSTDLLEWISCSGDSEFHDGAFHLEYNAGTMETGERGVRLYAKRYYHVTAEVVLGKDGVNPVYDNIDFVLYFRDGEGDLTEVAKFARVGDYSMGLSQCWTVACDCMPETDVELVLRVEGKDLEEAGGFTVTRFDVHRVFSGAPALPGGAVSKDMLDEGLAGKQDVIDDLSEIRAGAAAGATAVQPGDLAAVATSGSYNDLSNRPDLSVYATKSEVTSGLATKQDTLVAGDNITIEGNVISATGGGGATYTAGEGINIQNDEISVDTSVIQEKLTAGSNITISGTTISASAAPQEQADWNQTNSGAVDFIKNKPDLSEFVTDSEMETALSGKQDTLTAGDNITISGNTISATAAPQEQADWEQSDSSAVDFIKNKPVLATVATSGSYDDLSNTPTIPAAQVQSDWAQTNTAAVDFIKNKPSIPAAQVQSDWTESDTTDPSYIQNKPTEKVLTAGSNVTITDGVSTVTISATDTTYTAGSGLTLNNGEFAVDVGSGLTVTNSGLSVAADQSYNASSTNAQSGTAVAGALATVNQVPASTASDEDKVLTVNSSGVPVWRTPSGGGGGSGVQANWTESDSTDPSYIQNKPTEKPIVPGNGIAMSEDANAISISANPATLSSAQLLAIAQALGVDETVLWEGTITTSGHSNVNVTFQLSESILNFERIEVYCTGANNNVINFMTWHPVGGATGHMVASQIMNESENNTVYIGAAIYVEANSDYKTLRYRCGFGNDYGIAYRGDYWGYGVPYKVVGIRRIAGGN